MKIKYIKDRIQTVSQKIDILPLNPLIPMNFSKKCPSTDLLIKNLSKFNTDSEDEDIFSSRLMRTWLRSDLQK